MVLRKEELIELLLFISLSLMAQIYIDDIVFGASSSDFALNFAEKMKKKKWNEHGMWTLFLPRTIY